MTRLIDNVRVRDKVRPQAHNLCYLSIFGKASKLLISPRLLFQLDFKFPREKNSASEFLAVEVMISMDFFTFAFLFFVLPVLLIYIGLKSVGGRKKRLVGTGEWVMSFLYGIHCSLS